MPADERIKVIFHWVYVRDDADDIGSGDFYFQARAGSVQIGDPGHIFDAVEGHSIVFPQPLWSGIVNVAGVRELAVTFRGMDSDPFSDEDLGEMRHTLRFPFRQGVYRHGTPYYLLEWEVQLVVEGMFGRHAPNDVFACRQNTGSITCTTVSGATFAARMEFHPVRPVPSPPPNTVLPARPVFPATAIPDNNGGNTLIQATDPVNVIPNPAVIPILGPPTASPIGPFTEAQLDDANWANERNCSRIEYTYYQPNTLAFTDDDRRLEWRVVPVAGGNAAFLNRTTGRKVLVYGTAAGEVRLEVRFKGAVLASYRALVDNIRRMPCRANILNGTTTDSIPRATPDDVRNHLAIANRFLRQMCLELRLDTDPSRTDGAQPTDIPGIFRIRVGRGRTRNLDDAGQARASILNHRPGVMNFAYIHSTRDRVLGVGIDFPNSSAPGAAAGARPTITDNGSQSTSWIRPTGVGIGADATSAAVSMQLISGIQRAGHPQLYSMIITDGNGGARVPAGNHATLERQREYANTISHEFGHVLNLGHRVEGVPGPPARDMTVADAPATLEAGGIFWDGLLHPPHENVMQWRDPSIVAQDFDIIQAKGVRFSPIVTGAASVAPAVPGPHPPRTDGSNEYVIVAGDWLSKIAQRYGMTWQELYNYDGGTGMPNRERLRSGDPNLIYPGEVILVPATE